MFKISKIFVTIFYLGYSKIIPGTIGSLISFIIIYLAHISLNKIYLYILFIIFFILSLFLINFYQKTIKKIDSSEIIIDEFLGVFIIFLFFDYYSNINIYFFFFIGFLLFRFFDIYKPFPINWIDKKIKNSFGVIFDDIVAGIYSSVGLIIINEIIKKSS